MALQPRLSGQQLRESGGSDNDKDFCRGSSHSIIHDSFRRIRSAGRIHRIIYISKRRLTENAERELVLRLYSAEAVKNDAHSKDENVLLDSRSDASSVAVDGSIQDQ